MRERDNTGGGVVTTGLLVYARTSPSREWEKGRERRLQHAESRENVAEMQRSGDVRSASHMCSACIYVSDIYVKRYTHTYIHPTQYDVLILDARNLLQPHCSVMFEFRRLCRRDARVAFNLRCVKFIAYICAYALRALITVCITRRAMDARKKWESAREKEGCLCARIYLHRCSTI